MTSGDCVPHVTEILIADLTNTAGYEIFNVAHSTVCELSELKTSVVNVDNLPHIYFF